MKKITFLIALVLLSAIPVSAQTTEFGVLFGGTRRVIGDDDTLEGPEVANDFKFSNSNVELYFAIPLDPGTTFKIKGGRMEGPVAFAVGEDANLRRVDVEDGQIEHIDGIIQYDFSEMYGSTGIFIGVGLYRQKGGDFESETDFGASAGVNADFPISRRYGVVTEAAFHWTNFEFNPRYLTVSAGMRVSF